jgi:spore maturation protein CgeB
MTTSLHFSFFASSLVSSYWNGAATYYRGIVRALAARGHRVTFYEPDAYDRQAHRDIPDPSWAEVVVYPGDDEAAALGCLERAAKHTDVLVKASGIGVYDALLEQAVPRIARAGTTTVFWDVDAPATLERMRLDSSDAFRVEVPRYDLVLTYGGGAKVVQGYESFGARACIPVYNALDPETHFPAAREARFEATLGLLANRLPDREARVEEFFLRPASKEPGLRFLLGGNGWDDKPMPANVRRLGHVPTADHNAFNATPLAVLNVARDSMASCGFSPATRVFEAAGAAACIITDAWEGIDSFLEPGREVLVAESGDHVASIASSLTEERARIIGANARRRVLAEHTYAMRALQVESILLVKAHPPSPKARLYA